MHADAILGAVAAPVGRVVLTGLAGRTWAAARSCALVGGTGLGMGRA